MSKRYNVILFDLDGTLADTDPVIIETFNRFYNKYRHGEKKSVEELSYFSGPPIKKTLKEEFPEYDQKILLQEFHDISLSLFDSLIFSFPNCKDTIEQLKGEGFKLGVITNKRHDLAIATLHAVDLDNCFDLILGADDLEIGKPNPEGIYVAMRELEETNPDKVIYIGDNKSDYDFAINGGVHCGIVSWGPRNFPDELNPDFKFTNYSHLKENLYD